MAAVIRYVNPFAFWLIFFIIIIVLVVIFACIQNDRRRSRSDSCGDGKKKKKGSGGSDSDSCSDSWGNLFGSWCNGRKGFSRELFYATTFWVFALVGLLTGYPSWHGVVAAAVLVILVEIFKCSSKWARRHFKRYRWYNLLLVAIIGYLLGYVLAFTRCQFMVPGCWAPSESISYPVEVKNGLANRVGNLIGL